MALAAIQKSPDAFRTISEVASELGTPQHVLRFWESRFTQVKPMKRGGGRRYYRPEDIDLLRGICSLLYRDGLTIKGVQKILREQGPRYVMDLGRNSLSLLESSRASRPSLHDVSSWSAEEGDSDSGNPEDISPEISAEAVNHQHQSSVPASAGMLPEKEREHFEGLLDQLLVLKERLAASRSRLAR